MGLLRTSLFVSSRVAVSLGLAGCRQEVTSRVVLCPLAGDAVQRRGRTPLRLLVWLPVLRCQYLPQAAVRRDAILPGVSRHDGRLRKRRICLHPWIFAKNQIPREREREKENMSIIGRHLHGDLHKQPYTYKRVTAPSPRVDRPSPVLTAPSPVLPPLTPVLTAPFLETNFR